MPNMPDAERVLQALLSGVTAASQLSGTTTASHLHHVHLPRSYMLGVIASTLYQQLPITVVQSSPEHGWFDLRTESGDTWRVVVSPASPPNPDGQPPL